MSINLTNIKDLIVNSLSLTKGNQIENVLEVFLSKDESVSGIVGLPVSTLDTLEHLGNRIDNDPNFFDNNQIRLNQNANTAYVNTEIGKLVTNTDFNTSNDLLINNFTNYTSIASNTT